MTAMSSSLASITNVSAEGVATSTGAPDNCLPIAAGLVVGCEDAPGCTLASAKSFSIASWAEGEMWTSPAPGPWRVFAARATGPGLGPAGRLRGWYAGLRRSCRRRGFGWRRLRRRRPLRGLFRSSFAGFCGGFAAGSAGLLAGSCGRMRPAFTGSVGFAGCVVGACAIAMLQATCA